MKHSFFITLLLTCSLSILAQPEKDLAELYKNKPAARDVELFKYYMKVGEIYYLMGKEDSAWYYAKEELKLAQELKSDRALAVAYNHMGLLHMNYNRATESLEYFLKSLDYAEKVNNTAVIAATYNNISGVYAQQKNYKKVFETLAEARARFMKRNDTLSLLGYYSNIGRYLGETGEYKKAELSLDSGLYLSDRYKQTPALPDVVQLSLNDVHRSLQLNKGIILQKTGRPDDAVSILNVLYEDVSKSDDVQLQIETLNALAACYLEKNDYNNTIKYSLLNAELLRQDSIPDMYQQLVKNLALAYEGNGEMNKALFYQKEFKRVSDSLQGEKNIRNLNEIQTRYDTEKKDIQIKSLNKEKNLQKYILILAAGLLLILIAIIILAFRSKKLQQKVFSQREHLVKSEMEKKLKDMEQKALRAQMNPHFIFNALNSVHKYIMDNDKKGVERYLDTFSSLIRQTLDNSYTTFIPLKDELQYITTYLSLEQMRSSDRFKFDLQIAEDIDTEQTYIPGMILQPFLENAVRHGLAGEQSPGGLIKIRVRKNGMLSFQIEDNGIGLDKASRNKDKYPQVHASRGLGLVTNRVEAINNLYDTSIKLSLQDKKELDPTSSGTLVDIEFPLNLGDKILN